MTAAVLLLLWAVAVTTGLPKLLAGARWTRRAPALALLSWQALALSATVALALAVRQAIDPSPHHHAGLLHLCGLDTKATAGTAAAAVVLCPLAFFAAELWRAARRRRRHRELLDLTARRGQVPGAVVLDHPTPAVYCLPGRHRRVVVSMGALRTLSAAQLAAALAHERAHLSGRHHLAGCAAAAFGRAFGYLPLGRLIVPESRVLLEMAADDKALHRHSRLALAGAMTAVAAGPAPSAALTAGHQALARLERLAARHRRPTRAALALGTAGTVALAGLPLLLTCLPHLY